MKHLINKPITYITKEPDPSFTKVVDKVNESTYFDILCEICERPASQAGFSYSEIKSIDKIKSEMSGKTEANIEDADFEYLKERVINNRWSSANIQFVELTDYIKNL